MKATEKSILSECTLRPATPRDTALMQMLDRPETGIDHIYRMKVSGSKYWVVQHEEGVLLGYVNFLAKKNSFEMVRLKVSSHLDEQQTREISNHLIGWLVGQLEADLEKMYWMKWYVSQGNYEFCAYLTELGFEVTRTDDNQGMYVFEYNMLRKKAKTCKNS